MLIAVGSGLKGSDWVAGQDTSLLQCLSSHEYKRLLSSYLGELTKWRGHEEGVSQGRGTL